VLAGQTGVCGNMQVEYGKFLPVDPTFAPVSLNKTILTVQPKLVGSSLQNDDPWSAQVQIPPNDAQIIVAQNTIQANQWFAEEPQIQPQNNDYQPFGPQNPVPQPFLNETNAGSYGVSNVFASMIQSNNSTNLFSGSANVNPWANNNSDNNNNQFQQ
jgi:hypothetical protein